MDLKDLNILINKLKQINTVFPKLNSGGCGVYAHAVGLQLEKLGYDINIISLGINYDYDSNRKIKELRRNNSEFSPTILHRNNIGLYHVLVEVIDKENNESIVIDSNGENKIELLHEKECIHFQDMGLYVDARITLKECKLISDYKEGWNAMFDRSQIARVYEYVNHIFNITFNRNELQYV